MKAVDIKILVIGSDGQLGWELCRVREKQSFAFTTSDIPSPISAQGLPAVSVAG